MNLKNKNHKIISLVSSIFILAFIFLLSQTDISKTIAQTSNPKLSGYAWSDTTGWIHFATTTGAQNVVEIGSDGIFLG